MTGAYFEFEEVDSFTTGAVGKPRGAHVLPPGPPGPNPRGGEV